MSLKRTQMAGGKEKLKDMEFIDIAPKLKKADIQVAINGKSVVVLALDHVKEYVSSKQKIAGYCGFRSCRGVSRAEGEG